MQLKLFILSAILGLAAAHDGEDHGDDDSSITTIPATLTTKTKTYGSSSLYITKSHTKTYLATTFKANSTVTIPKTNYLNSTTGVSNSTIISIKTTASLDETSAPPASTTGSTTPSTTSRVASTSSSAAAAALGRSSQFGLAVLGAAVAAGLGL